MPGVMVGAANHQWRGKGASVSAGHQRAQHRFPDLGQCQECLEKPAVERHHRDGDTLNNTPENVTLLCRRCHMVLDGRLETLARRPRTQQEPKPCTECGRPYKPLRRGLCSRCNDRKRRMVG